MILPARPRKPQDKAKVEVRRAGRRALDPRPPAPPAFLLGGRTRCRHRVNCSPALNNRPFKKLPGCRREAFEIARCAVPAAAAGDRLRHAPNGRRRRSTSTTTSSSTAAITACRMRWFARQVESAHHAPHGRGAGQGQAGGEPSAQSAAKATTPPSPNTCRRPIGRMPSGRRASS